MSHACENPSAAVAGCLLFLNPGVEMSRVVQLKYFNLAAWPREVTEVIVGTAVAAAEFGLPTNVGSRHATLAAKNAWMQCKTAKRLENSSSWPRKQTQPQSKLLLHTIIAISVKGCLPINILQLLKYII